MANRYADRYAKLRDAWSAKQPQRINTGGFNPPVAPLGADTMVSPQRYAASNYEYPKILPGATGNAGASMGLVSNPAGGSLEGEMLPGMQSQGFSPQAAAENAAFSNPKKLFEGTLDQVRGGKPPSPFENASGVFTGSGPPVPGGPSNSNFASDIPPGTLANGFDPRFMNKPKAPLWP